MKLRQRSTSLASDLSISKTQVTIGMSPGGRLECNELCGVLGCESGIQSPTKHTGRRTRRHEGRRKSPWSTLGKVLGVRGWGVLGAKAVGVGEDEVSVVRICVSHVIKCGSVNTSDQRAELVRRDAPRRSFIAAIVSSI